MTELWHLGMSSWFVADGNYEHFAAGDEPEFALEFYVPGDVERVEPAALGATWRQGPFHDVVARVVFRSRKLWVLDFGLLAYQEMKPPKALKVGDHVRAEMYLGVDPFPYFEYLHKLRGMPPMIYSWRIESILLDRTPFIETWMPGKGAGLKRDKTRVSYRQVYRTDARFDGGSSEFVLECRRLSTEAKQSRREPG